MKTFGMTTRLKIYERLLEKTAAYISKYGWGRSKLGFSTFFKLLFRGTSHYWASVLTFGFCNNN